MQPHAKLVANLTNNLAPISNSRHNEDKETIRATLAAKRTGTR
jgi:hypothetical protein